MSVFAAASVDARLQQWSRDVGQSFGMRAGTLALLQGEPPRQVLLLETGEAFLRRVESSGVEVSVALCQAGSLLGLASVVRRVPHAVSARMKTDGTVVAIPAERVTDALARPDLAPALMSQLVSDHLGLIQRYGAQVLPVRERLVALLRDFEIRAGRVPYGVDVSTTDLASLIGADVSHVCRVLRILRAEGVVDFSRGRLIVRIALT